jgi:dipeptidyl aminopeptidase/acylaminoacyl peptidase
VTRPAGDDTAFWVHDVQRGTEWPLATVPRVGPAPVVVFSPDGTTVVYRMGATTGGYTIHQRTVGGAAAPRVLLSPPELAPTVPLDWSPDGAELLYTTMGGGPLRFLSVADGRVRTPAHLEEIKSSGSAVFSSDGRWLAFSTPGVRRDRQVLITSLIDPKQGVWPASGPGGNAPRWRRDGRELFFVDLDGYLSSVSVETKPRLAVGKPARLFDLGPDGRVATTSIFDVTGDGNQFVSVRSKGGVQDVRLRVISNWSTEGSANRTTQ